MGIRFRCHHCELELHVKDFQGGKRGRCPQCRGRFLVPKTDVDYSTDPESSRQGNRQSPRTETIQETNHPQLDLLKHRGEQDDSFCHSDVDAPSSRSVQAGKPTASPHDPASTAPEIQSTEPRELGARISEVQTSEAQTSLDSDNLQPESMVPLAIRQAGESTWYVCVASGEQYGPAPSETFVQWLIENRVTRDSLVWCDGWPEWQSAEIAFADYFGSALDAEGQRETSLDAMASLERPPELPSLSERNREARRRRKKRNYTILMASLVLLTIGLLTALAMILLTQNSGAVS